MTSPIILSFTDYQTLIHHREKDKYAESSDKSIQCPRLTGIYVGGEILDPRPPLFEARSDVGDVAGATKYATALLAIKVQEDVSCSTLIRWAAWHSLAPHIWSTTNEVMISSGKWRSNLGDKHKGWSDWVVPFATAFGITLDGKAHSMKEISELFIGRQAEKPKSGATSYWERLQFARFPNNQPLDKRGRYKLLIELLFPPNVGFDESDETKAALRDIVVGWGSSKRTDSLTKHFHQNHRWFARWCKELIATKQKPTIRKRIEAQIKEAIQSAEHAATNEHYTDEQLQLTRWMFDLSRAMASGDDYPATPAAVTPALAHDTLTEITSDTEIAPHPHSEHFLTGEVRPHTREVEVKACQQDKNGEIRELTILVQELAEDEASVVYPHPAFALAITRSDLPRLHRAVSATLDATGPTPAAFRWALIDHDLINHLPDDSVTTQRGGQLSAAVLIAAYILRALDKGVLEEHPKTTIWVQLQLWDKGLGGTFQLRSVDCDIAKLDALIEGKIRNSTDLSRHVILAANTEGNRNFAEHWHGRIRLAPLGQTQTDFIHFQAAVMSALKKNKLIAMPVFEQKDFSGRTKQLKELTQWLTKGKVVGVTQLKGIGGIGKTTLAQKAASDLAVPNGPLAGAKIIPIELYGHDEGKGIDPIAALEYLCIQGLEMAPTMIEKCAKDAKQEVGDDERMLREATIGKLRSIYLDALENKTCIIILDNAKDGRQVEPLLPEPGWGGKSAFIITSRNVIATPRLPKEQCIDLNQMNAFEVEEWLRKADHTAPLLSHVPEILRATGGLPLAISLLISVWQNGGHRDDAETFMEGFEALDERIVPTANEPRHPYDSLATCFGQSVGALILQDKRLPALFYRLGIQNHRFDAAAVRILNEEPNATLKRNGITAASRLLDASLLEMDKNQVVLKPRYWMHDLVRDYAAKQLPTEERRRTKMLTIMHYAGVAAYCGNLFRKGGVSCSRATILFMNELESFKAVRVWARQALEDERLEGQVLTSDQRRRIAIAFVCYSAFALRVSDLSHDARMRDEWLSQAIEIAKVHLPEWPLLLARLTVAHGLALRHLAKDEPTIWAAMKKMSEVKAMFESDLISDETALSDAYGNWGNLWTDLGDRKSGDEVRTHYEEAEKCHLMALELSRKSDARYADRGIGQDLGNLAIVHTKYALLEWLPPAKLGHYQESQREYEERISLAARPSVLDHRGRANGMGNLANLLCQQAMEASENEYAMADPLALFEKAYELHQIAFDLHGEARNVRGQAASKANLAVLCYLRGVGSDIVDGDRHSAEGRKLFMEIFDTFSADTCDANAEHAHQAIAANRLPELSRNLRPGMVFHRADRYGKITDWTLSDFGDMNLSEIEDSMECCKELYGER